MFKKSFITILGVGLLVAPAFVLAQSTDVQSQVAALQAQIQQLLAQITQLEGGTSSSCVDLSQNLTLGSSGNDVTSLQNYLIGKGDLDAQYNTGYYGFLTASAVGKLQVSLGIVPAASDPAYGITGPKTRAAIQCNDTPPQSTTLSASPTSGAAPLAVHFSGSGLESGSQYVINFGDGQTSDPLTSGITPCAFGATCTPVVTTSHTYVAAGTYTATLTPYYACPNNGICNVPNEQILGTATIIVTSGTAVAGAPTISGIDAPVSLSVGQSGTWTVHASVPNQPNAQLSYSVVWGDETANPLVVSTGAAASSFQTTATFTHAYQNAGTYQPVFTVSNSSGSAQSSASVVVGANTTSTSLSASPTSGTAPLAVSFSGTGLTGGSQYIIDYGDGNNSGALSAVDVCMHLEGGSGGCPKVGANHTYATAGTYSAILGPYIGCMWGSGIRCMIATVPLGTATITVTGNSTIPDPGNITQEQLTAYPDCEASLTNQTPLPTMFTCKVGQRVAWGSLIGSINPDSIHVYTYGITPAGAFFSEWSSKTISIGQAIDDVCGRKTVLDSVNYAQQTMTVSVSADNSGCPL